MCRAWPLAVGDEATREANGAPADRRRVFGVSSREMSITLVLRREVDHAPEEGWEGCTTPDYRKAVLVLAAIVHELKDALMTSSPPEGGPGRAIPPPRATGWGRAWVGSLDAGLSRGESSGPYENSFSRARATSRQAREDARGCRGAHRPGWWPPPQAHPGQFFTPCRPLVHGPQVCFCSWSPGQCAQSNGRSPYGDSWCPPGERLSRPRPGAAAVPCSCGLP
jgi:hypothetical protein